MGKQRKPILEKTEHSEGERQGGGALGTPCLVFMGPGCGAETPSFLFFLCGYPLCPH